VDAQPENAITFQIAISGAVADLVRRVVWMRRSAVRLILAANGT
jgi:hypothetical protein